MVWFGRKPADDDDYDAIAAAPDPIGRAPDEELQNSEAMQSLEMAVRAAARAATRSVHAADV